MSKRIGTFSIALRERQRPGYLEPLLSKVRVLKKETVDFGFTEEFTAESELFDVVEDGKPAPDYQILCTKHPDGSVTCEFKKR
jgi:hypothetical protein